MSADAPIPTHEPPPGRLAIHVTGDEAASALATIVSRAFKRALAFDTALPRALYERDARSGRKMRMVVANLADAMPGARCLAIGAGDGALACAALSGRAGLTCIDAWTEAGTRALFQDTLDDTVARFAPDRDVVVMNTDFETLDYKPLGVFNILILESRPDRRAPLAAAEVESSGKRVEAALARAVEVLDTDFVLIVDDWSLPAVRASLETSLRARRLSCLYAIDIRIGLAPDQGETGADDWGRGSLVAVLRKRPSLICSLLALGTRR